MKADSLVIIGAAAALLFLGLIGYIITDTETNLELIPGGDPANESDFVEIQSEIRPFMKVGVSSVMFGIIILSIFLLAAGIGRLRR